MSAPNTKDAQRWMRNGSLAFGVTKDEFHHRLDYRKVPLIAYDSLGFE
jgi:hypothetical protein